MAKGGETYLHIDLYTETRRGVDLALQIIMSCSVMSLLSRQRIPYVLGLRLVFSWAPPVDVCLL